jgi:glucosylceramidase
MGHFARFIRPGARRVLCSASLQDLETTAFVNADGMIAVVAMNRSHEPKRFVLQVDGGRWLTELPARSIATYLA